MTSSQGSAHRPGWSSTQRWAVAGLIGLGSVALTLLYFHRPEGQFFFPRCTFYQTTGLLCPGCGGLRATHALLHGHLLEAARCNLLLVLALPLALVGCLGVRRRGKPINLNARVVWVMFGVAAIFTIARNLPGPTARWLSP